MGAAQVTFDTNGTAGPPKKNKGEIGMGLKSVTVEVGETVGSGLAGTVVDTNWGTYCITKVVGQKAGDMDKGDMNSNGKGKCRWSRCMLALASMPISCSVSATSSSIVKHPPSLRQFLQTNVMLSDQTLL